MSVVSAEKNLLLAARNAIRTAMALPETECEIEYDENAPATVGHRYLAVMPGGYRPYDVHNTSGGVRDLLYGLSVLVIVRANNVPRDRKRDVFLGNLGNLAELEEKVINGVDWTYAVMNAANTLILAETANAQGFMEPLKFAGVDSKPRVIPAEAFGSSNGPGGLGRAVHFHGARRITYT
jgi:hypothetical protein